MNLPDDAVMLMSVINMKLRDFYKNLDELCDDMDIDKSTLCEKLSAAGFLYDEDNNKFI